MARQNELTPIEMLMRAPWWISAILAVCSYIGLKYVIPGIFTTPIQQGKPTSGIMSNVISQVAPKFAPIVVLIFTVAGIMSIIINFIERKKAGEIAKRKRDLFERQKELKDISSLTWQEFEEFIAEAYRRNGYQVKECGGGGPDGGIDLILEKMEERILVQCKHWYAQQVGVKIVRELYGVLAAEGATKGIVITSGQFTRAAEIFAHGKPLALIHGNELSRLIEAGQKSLKLKATQPVQSKCDKCGKDMKLRIASTGSNEGKKFWVCSSYPECKNVVPAAVSELSP